MAYTPRRSFPEQGGSAWYPDGYVPADDEGPDYKAEYSRRIDNYLGDLRNYEFIGEALGGDAEGAQVLQHIIVDLDNRILGKTKRGDLEADMAIAIRTLSRRATELAYEPICADVDSDIKDSREKREQMRKYGEVVE